MDECISVIVPVYNVENYLSDCVDSILAQTYGELEIILVDDGSTDGCGAICDEYVKKDFRVKVIHKKNGGLGDARNAGIQAAAGKYLAFVDSDDMLDQKMFEKLYDALKQANAQAAICGFQYMDDAGRCTEKCLAGEHSFLVSGKEVQKRYFENYNASMIYTVAWNKLYSRELFQQLRYPAGVLHEDEFLTMRVLYSVQKIAVIPYAGYLYRMREKSIMDRFDARRFQLFDAYISRLKFYEEKEEKVIWLKTFQLYLHMFEQYVQWQKEKGIKSESGVVEEYRRKLNKLYQKSRYHLSGRLWAEYEMSMKMPGVYHAIWKMMK